MNKKLIVVCSFAMLFSGLLSAQTAPVDAAVKIPLQLEWELSSELELSAAVIRGSDFRPARGTPRLDLDGYAVSWRRLPGKAARGTFFRAGVEFQGDWVRIDQFEGGTGVAKPPAYQRSVWVLEEVEHELAFGRVLSANRWTLETAFISSGVFNDYQKDYLTDLGEYPVESFTAQSFGAGIFWSQRAGSTVRFDYAPSFELLYQLDGQRPWVRMRLDADLRIPHKTGRWQLSASPRFSNQWHPRWDVRTRASGYFDRDYVRWRLDLIGYDWSVNVPDGDADQAIGQSARWYSAVRASWRARDNTFSVGISQDWWSIDRARVNESRDKPLRLTFGWTASGSEKK